MRKITTTIQDKAIEICERLSCHEIMDDDAACLQQEWDCDPRWQGIHRPYTPEEVLKLRGTLKLEHTFAEVGAQRLWYLLQTEDYIAALGAMTGNQAVPQSLQLGERVEPKARRGRRPNLYNCHLYSVIRHLFHAFCLERRKKLS